MRYDQCDSTCTTDCGHKGAGKPLRGARPDFATSTPEIEREAKVRLARLQARTVRRCEADSERGTGTGACDAPLDERGNCPRAGRHVV